MKGLITPICLLCCYVFISWFSYNQGKKRGYELGAQQATKATVNWYNTNVFAPIIRATYPEQRRTNK